MTSDTNPLEIIKEINEMVHDATTDDNINEESVKYAKQFLVHVILLNKSIYPDLELHSDGETAITFRNSRGILNIAFNAKSRATYAVYLPKKQEKHKGIFMVNNNIPENVINYIEELSTK